MRQGSQSGLLIFVSPEAGGRAAAIAHTLIEAGKINSVDSPPWLGDFGRPAAAALVVPVAVAVAVEQIGVRLYAALARFC